jgi:YfiH family protein
MHTSNPVPADLDQKAGIDQAPRPLVAVAWAEFPWLVHGFSTRAGGVSRAYARPAEPGELNLGFTADDTAENVRENRRRLVEAVTGSGTTPLMTVRQIHSDRSEVVPLNLGEGQCWDAPQADGLLTRRTGILLGIMTADCVPVLVADPRHRAVAAFHAGWRGTVERVVEQGIARMHKEFGSLPGEMIAAIGPAIGRCCYAVGDEVRTRFGSEFSYGEELFAQMGTPAGNSRSVLDLVDANRRQLLAAGLTVGAISLVGGCTSCHTELYFSHRASGGRAGRMMSVIGIKAE